MKSFAWKRWFSIFVTVLGCAVFLRTGTADSSATTTSDVVVILWGDPALVAGDSIAVIGPSWCVGALKSGGEWQSETNNSSTPAWIASTADSGAAFLLIDLDRASVTGDVRMDISLDASTDAVVCVDLLNALNNVLATNVAGSLASAADVPTLLSSSLPFSQYPSASAIRIRRENGDVAIYNTVLEQIAPVAATASETQPGNNQRGGISAPSTSTYGSPAAGGTSDSMNATNVITGGGTPAAGTAGTNSASATALAGNVIYVDAATGNDANSGRLTLNTMTITTAVAAPSPVEGNTTGQTGNPTATNTSALILGNATHTAATNAVAAVPANGPKATIHAGLAAATPRDIIVIRPGHYPETLNLAGMSGRVHMEGNVNLSGRPAASGSDQKK